MSFAQDAGLFAHQIDIPNDRVLLVRLSEADYRAASFLDNRLLQPATGPQPAMQWAGWSDLASQTAPDARANAQFIFHIGHVGSTLIARLLGEANDTLALREPQILRQFAELKQLTGQPHSPWAPEQFEPRLKTTLQWLSRTFRTDQRSLIKATSFVSDIAPELTAGDGKSVFLYLSPERYMQTILAGDNSRQELAVLSGSRLQRLHRRMGEAPFRLWELDEATRAAMGWLCEMTALLEATSENALWLNFDRFLKNPAEQLLTVAAHLEIDLSTEEIDELIAGPIMRQYSKAPEHGYSPQLREDVLGQAARDHGARIKAALEWLSDAGRKHPIIARAIERGNKD